MGLVLFLHLDGTLVDVFVQADAGRDARVGADDIRGRYRGAAQQIGRDARLQRRVGSNCALDNQISIIFRETYVEDRWRIAALTTSCTGIIIRRAGRVVVVSAGIGRRVGYIVGGQLATLTRFLRIGVCVSREPK